MAQQFLAAHSDHLGVFDLDDDVLGLNFLTDILKGGNSDAICGDHGSEVPASGDHGSMAPAAGGFPLTPYTAAESDGLFSHNSHSHGSTGSGIALENFIPQLPDLPSATGWLSKRNNTAAASSGVPASSDSTVLDDLTEGGKKRSRNSSQMEMNRIAQRQYRERKKSEQDVLQTKLDAMSSELTALKLVHSKAVGLQRHNKQLTTLHAEQQAKIIELEMKSIRQKSELEMKVYANHYMIKSVEANLEEVSSTLSKAQKMILDQHERGLSQKELYEVMKEKVRLSVESAWQPFQTPDQTLVCRRTHAAVRAALEGAKDMDGVRDSIASLPDKIIYLICHNIMVHCKDMWPGFDLSEMQAGGQDVALRHFDCEQHVGVNK
eukprot:gene12383-15575_t